MTGREEKWSGNASEKVLLSGQIASVKKRGGIPEVTKSTIAQGKGAQRNAVIGSSGS